MTFVEGRVGKASPPERSISGICEVVDVGIWYDIFRDFLSQRRLI